MILGIGTDLCNIARISASLARFGERFEARIFTAAERAAAPQADEARAAHYAKRWAAKEAYSKALGTGFQNGVFMPDIGVINQPSGAPALTLSGGASRRLAESVPSGHEAIVHLSLSDDPPWAQAFVVIEAQRIGRAAS